MHIALVSNGPSGATFPVGGRAAYDLLVGVNKVATLHRCDWWSFTDMKTYKEEWDKVLGRPQFFTKRPAYRKIQKLMTGEPHAAFTQQVADSQVLVYDELEHPPPRWHDCPEWFSWSGCPALALCVNLKATKITYFGVDLEGDHDVRGELDVSRLDTRWVRERILWRHLVEWATDEHGVEVVNGAA